MGEMTSITKKHFIFLRQLPPILKGEWGGLEKLMFDWLKRIDYQKADVTVVVTTGWQQRFQEEAKKYALPLNIIEFEFTDNYWQRFIGIFSLLKSQKPSGCVFFQAWYSDVNLADLLAAFLSTRGQVYMHENLGSPLPLERSTKKYFGFLPRLGLWWYFQRALINLRPYLCKKVLVVSKDIKEKYVSEWKYPQRKIAVTYHGVDAVRYAPSQEIRQKMREKLHVGLSDKVFITTARFTQQKCLGRVIEAFDTVWREDKNMWLLMAGNGPLDEELRKLAASSSCRDRIIFLGNLEDTADYLKMSDIFVLSSDNEGLSLALLEAMASGLLCISTDCRGSGEVIQDGVTGFLVDKSAEAVLQGMRKAVLLSPADKQRLTQAAVKCVRENFEINARIKLIFDDMGLPYHKGS